jgi:hypothetical protein
VARAPRDSVAVVTAHKRPDGRVAVQSRIWTPPKDGKIDHLEVLDHIRDLAGRYTVTEVVYDPRFFEVPARTLEDEAQPRRIPAVGRADGPGVRTALQMIVAGESSTTDPDLTAHVTAAAIRPGDRRFTLSKGKSRRKIDACIARRSRCRGSPRR